MKKLFYKKVTKRNYYSMNPDATYTVEELRVGWEILLVAGKGIGMVIGGALALLALGAFFIGVFAAIKPINEIACNDKGEEYQMEPADYRFWADTCFVTLPDGRGVNADKIEIIETGRGFKVE